MQSYRLTINDDWFYLSTEYNIADLKTALSAAVHSGGGFVDVVSSMRSHVSMLITAHSTVKIETINAIDLPDLGDDTTVTSTQYLDDNYWLD
ncbi:hypothetical protein [Cryobacterium sp. Y11]|uniref:hypothetical protein n=1 Tax=Cryobacterium sp. Y11 TaxID=2045016 RepID=UPI000CE4400A|nr:hypothetical protein [Cryobacterium sp. Y11]